MAKRRSAEETERLKQTRKTMLLFIMAGHVGRSKKIGMGELHEEVFKQGWNHRINDTRSLRTLITELRNDGTPICSDSNGYWLASAGSELNYYCSRLHDQALKKLIQEARLRKMSLPDLLGQTTLELRK